MHDTALPVDHGAWPSTCTAALIVERPGQRLRALVGAPRTREIALLNRSLRAYQLAFLRQHGVTRVIHGAMPPLDERSDSASAEPHMARPVLVLESDVLTEADVSAMLRFHAEQSTAVTVMLTRDSRSGDAQKVDGGLYVVDTTVLTPVLARRSASGPRGFLATLLAEGVRWSAWYSRAYWRRIHTPTAYHAASMDLLSGRAGMLVDPPGASVNGSWIGDDVRIGSDATIQPASVVGSGAELGAGTRIGPRAVIGAGSRIGSHVHITESVVGDDVVIGTGAILDGCVVGHGARVAPFSILASGAVLAGGAVQRSRTLLPR